MAVTTAASMAVTEVATASASHESVQPQGRPGDGAAAARTEELFAEYGRTVHGLCRALLRDRAEAEDAAQQTFLSVHRALLNGIEPREPAAWLATIARNECWARIRARMREPLPAKEFETAATTNDPLAEAIRRADLAALWHAIEELPRQQRDALLLREFGGLTYDELASALAVSGPAVESLLFRARQRLRGRLRAAYASISGASWIDALVRLAAGGGAPVAAKVAALGVGAAAVGGSAVVVPQMFDNHKPSHSPQRAPAAVHRSHVTAPAPALVERVVSTQAPAVHVRGDSGDGGREHQGKLAEPEHAVTGGDGDHRSVSVTTTQSPGSRSDGQSGTSISSGSGDSGGGLDSSGGALDGSGTDGGGGDGTGGD